MIINMSEIVYKQYTEVLELLTYFPKSSVLKIPEKELEIYLKYRDKNYKYTVDTTKKFEDQVMMEETKAIFANIFKKYWATEYQRERILAKEKYDMYQLEAEKRKKYDPHNIFKNRINESIEVVAEDNNLPIEIKKEKWYANFLKRIKSFFRK